MESLKYPRTYHFPFSPGTTSDDRIKQNWQEILTNELVITENWMVKIPVSKRTASMPALMPPRRSIRGQKTCGLLGIYTEGAIPHIQA